MLNKHHGFTLIEAIVSIFILTTLVASTLAIVYQMKNQALASERKLLASEVSKTLKDELEETLVYSDVLNSINQNQTTISFDDCINRVVSCQLLESTLEDTPFEKRLTITFYEPNIYNQIFFDIELYYFKDRMITIEGVIYE
ncbi:MAG: prepilin-type N-terminal cleavage/methylation domain-containing protein [Paracholeplasma sp.]|nr:prepilin-type N-terminal cleavage/methylation domain-containing protein [Paracholeplasma sp.]MDY3195269.1 prepilin-type N-terminal cleavage/methylation domain-containing protein [Paracholeplasma sp.]